MAYKMIHRHLSHIIDEINTFNRHSAKLLYKTYSDKYQKELWIILLYFSQIELVKNIHQMLLLKNPISIPILVRSSIDILVQMNICNKDVNKLLSHYKHQVLSDFNDFKKYIGNTNLSKFTKEQLIQINSYLEYNNDTLQDLSDFEKNKLFEASKRNIAELHNDLEILYKNLSDHVHHGYDTLVGRSRVLADKKYRASKAKILDKHCIYTCIAGLVKCILLSIIELFKCIRLPSNHNLRALIDETDKLKIILDKNLADAPSGVS